MQSDATQNRNVAPVLILHDSDNVAIARRMITQGTALGGSIVA